MATLQELATEVSLRVLPHMSTEMLIRTLGDERICDIFAHVLQNAEGRAMVLRCMTRPRCSELWQNLDNFPDNGRLLRLTRDPNLTIGITPDNLLSYCAHTRGYPSLQIQSYSELRKACTELQAAGVTEEEIQCIIGPMTTLMNERFPDSVRDSQ